MKRYIKVFAGALASVSILASCSGSLVNLKYEDEMLVNKRLGLSYAAASTVYQPVSIGEAYGYFGDIDMTLYQIAGLDPKQWLTEEYTGNATMIFVDKDITLPTLSELQATEIFVCADTEITYAVATIEEQEIVDALVDVFENGEECEWPLIDSIVTYEMKFHSEELYPHIYYNLIYGEFESGKYLYDQFSKRCVNIGTILDGTEID